MEVHGIWLWSACVFAGLKKTRKETKQKCWWNSIFTGKNCTIVVDLFVDKEENELLLQCCRWLRLVSAWNHRTDSECICSGSFVLHNAHFSDFFYEGTRILCKNCAGDRHKTKLGLLFFDYEAHEVTWICLSIDTDLAVFSCIIDAFSRSGDGDTAKHSLKTHKTNFKQISAHVMIIVLT